MCCDCNVEDDVPCFVDVENEDDGDEELSGIFYITLVSVLYDIACRYP